MNFSPSATEGLKTLRVAAFEGTFAERLFGRAWARLVRGDELETVALEETLRALIATRLGGVDARVLRNGGLDEESRLAILQSAFDKAATGLDGSFQWKLRALISPRALEETTQFSPLRRYVPEFALSLQKQGCAPFGDGDNFAAHSALAAIHGVLESPENAGQMFLRGLSRDLHHARLPAVEEGLLGENYATLRQNLVEMALDELPADLRVSVQSVLE